jgi:hypothetical protein
MADSIAKYSKDAPFEDPVVRCDSCQTLLLVTVLRDLGRCGKCGSHKVRNVFSFTPEEGQQMQSWGVDQAFLKLFESVEEEGIVRGRQ